MKRTALLRRSDGKDRASVAILRPKTCAKSKGGCGEKFQPMRSMQAACSPRCAEGMATTKRQKEERKTDKARRERLKKLPQWRAEAQAAFNRFIRERDYGKPCIDCGRFSSGAGRDRGGEWDAGHFRSRGACPELAFDENNVHAQLKHCNRRSWDVAAYRANLIERIGLAEVEKLEGPHPPRKYTADDYKSIKKTYSAKAAALRKAREHEL